MKNFKLLPLTMMLALAVSCSTSVCNEDTSYVDFVNPLAGTLSNSNFSTGNVYPAIARPWGMNFWTPQTGRTGDGWIYSYYTGNEYKMRGFEETHQPSPWMGDYGQFAIMPETNGPVFDQDARASWFSHKSEVATPYYYSVYLADHDATLECAPTERAAAFRITYPERELSYLVIDCDCDPSEIKIEDNKVYGISRRNRGAVSDAFANHFVLEFDTPLDYAEIVSENGTGAIVGFKTAKGQQVGIKAASSFISFEQADINLLELGDGDIDRIKEEGKSVWNEALSRVKVEDNNIDNLRIFYTCLYRSLLFPRDLAEIDADGKMVHFSPHDGQVHEGHLFVDTGFWDTFRSLFALIDWIYPETATKVQEGLVNHALESGYLPEWSDPGHRDCMIGNNSASVVAEAYLKGIDSGNSEVLWQALVKGANSMLENTSSGRRGADYYNTLGYVPCNVGIRESAARTLEYAYDDWCIYQFGKAIGKSEEELAQYLSHAKNYQNVYRAECSWACGRNEDGSWHDPFNPFKWGGDFTEGNAIQYTWSAFHDPKGLSELMGGDEKFAENLDTIFTMPPIFDDSSYGYTIHEIREMQVMNYGNYAHGNQPAQHIAYMYDWCGQPWKTQQRVREIMDRFYKATPDSYCGDEDNGQTSAWYVFSAMGFYPVCPASCEYALGSPLFKKVTVKVPGNKPVVIKAIGNSPDKIYVDSATLNGRTLDRNYITHKELLDGADLTFEMSDTPSLTRGIKESDKPYSMTE